MRTDGQEPNEDHDFDEALQLRRALAFELDGWARNESAYSQIGVSVCVYRLVG